MEPDEETKKKIQAEFDRIRAELDTPEGQERAEAETRRQIRKAAEEHRAFLARSKARAHTRKVYR
ncbi:MAG: hypothetical protein RDU25_05870 [Patescibacteria group bacterium]|nr:hypothetical protein [Patescibacteria group bacterium]